MTDLEIALLKARTGERSLVAQMRRENDALRQHLGSLAHRLSTITDAVERIEHADAANIARLQQLLLQQAELPPGAKLNATR